MKRLPLLISVGLMLAAVDGCAPRPEPESTPKLSAPPPAEKPTPARPAERKPEPAPIAEVDASQVFALREQNKALIYDVRLPLYYKLGHINGAISFFPKPFDKAFEREQPQMTKAIDEGKTIILYCGGADCHDSHQIGKMIAERGIPVSVYSGGWSEWQEIGIE